MNKNIKKHRGPASTRRQGEAGNTILIVMLLGALAALTLGFLVMRNAIKDEPASQTTETNSDQTQNTPSEEKPAEEEKPVVIPELATWKTYTNAKYGYSLKHPANLKVGSISGNSVLGT